MQAVCDRLDSIEELLKLSLAANVLNDLEVILPEEREVKLLPRNISSYLNICGMSENCHYKKFDKTVIELKCRENTSLQDLYTARKWIVEEIKNTIPVFCFNKLSKGDKENLLEEKISFLINNEELQIFNI